MTDFTKLDTGNECVSTPSLRVVEPPKCDIEHYRKYVESFELSPEEETELIESVWLIMAAFVDLGFGVDSMHCLQSFDQKPRAFPLPGGDGQDNQVTMKGGIDDE